MMAKLDGGVQEMLDLIASLPDQLETSSGLPGLSEIGNLSRRPRQVLYCGMGGSAIAGDLVGPLLAAADFSFGVRRDYGLPAWVGPETLVVASSYSGNTEETLSTVKSAADRRCHLVALTSGGQLRSWSLGDGNDSPRFPVVELPPGLPPRASLGFGLGALLWTLHRLGLTPSPEVEIQTAVEVLRQGNRTLGDSEAADHNEAIQLTRQCQGRFPVIYTSSGEAHGVGRRWKAQLNENAKMPAYCVPFPELNHNDIVGWQLSPALKKEYVLLILRGGDESERAALRVAATDELLQDEFAGIHQVRPHGTTTLARIFSLVQLGDYLSCYLALATGVDPVPVTRIDHLKDLLQEGSDT